MFQGTGSDVGKSLVVAGICRLMTTRGLKVKPFKPQNMSNNAAVTKEGGEIGRAQALQAKACRVSPSIDMNPILLKPQSEIGAQLIILGKVDGNYPAKLYQEKKIQLLPLVIDAVKRLEVGTDLIIVEGAGSAAEVNLRDNIKKIVDYLKINKKNNTTITTMPLGYSYGLSILHTHLYAGAKIILNNKSIFEKDFWNLIKKNKVNSLNGVPEFYEYLKKINFEKRIEKSIKYLTQAGGKINEETLSYFGKICKKNNIKFIVMYGQTEASPRMTYLKWRDFFTKFKSIGKPLNGYKIELVDAKRRVIKKKMKTGEIVFYGKNVSLGYSNSKKDLKKGDENKGKIFTGDIAFKDENGFFFIVGRNNRTIKLFGKRFNLDDIERYFQNKNLTVKCKFENSKIVLFVSPNFEKNIEVSSLSNFLNINKNFIVVKQKIKSFKDYRNV